MCSSERITPHWNQPFQLNHKKESKERKILKIDSQNCIVIMSIATIEFPTKVRESTVEMSDEQGEKMPV